MSTEDQEIVVSVEDLPAAEGAEKINGVHQPSSEDAVKALTGQYEELKTQAEADRALLERQAADARREAADARREAEEARSRVNESELETVSSGIEASKTAADAAQAEYERAFEAGDVKAMGLAQRRMARAEADISRLEEAKSTIEVRKPEAKKAEPAADDPTETWISQKAPEAQRWLRAHREYVTDTRKNAALNAGHYDAIAKGIEINSDGYFTHIETYLGLKETKTKDTTGREHKPNGQFAPKRNTPPSAPVNGASTAGGGELGNTVRLTRAEALAATDGTHSWNYDDPSGQKRFKKGDPIGLTEFAKRKLALTKQGAYDRSYTEGQ